MTLQQMEYIVALDKYRHFVLAAEACGVTQPTLSAMIQKLEEELDVKNIQQGPEEYFSYCHRRKNNKAGKNSLERNPENQRGGS